MNILIVDDHAMVRETIISLLRAATDWEIVSFESGQDFVSNWDGAGDCVLLDARMPIVSGWDVLHHLQRRDAAIPVILMSGHLDDVNDTNTTYPNLKAFLAKPFSGKTLINTIHEHIT
ncbi:MAG: response regulator [Pseudomonadota bacterium]